MLSLGCGDWLDVCKTPWLTLLQSPWLTAGLPVHALLQVLCTAVSLLCKRFSLWMVSSQLYPGACHNKPRRKPWPSRVVRGVEAQTYMGGRVMEEAEIKICGWLWCAVVHSRPLLGTHQTNLLCSVVTGEVMMPCC